MIEQKAIELILPPQDDNLLWWSGVIIPVVLAVIGWIINKRKH